jgi:hypothetical protein
MLVLAHLDNPEFPEFWNLGPHAAYRRVADQRGCNDHADIAGFSGIDAPHICTLLGYMQIGREIGTVTACRRASTPRIVSTIAVPERRNTAAEGHDSTGPSFGGSYGFALANRWQLLGLDQAISTQ